MSGTNAAQGANGYNQPISPEEIDDNVWDQIDNLDHQDPDFTLSTPEQFKHQGNVRDRIKELSEKGKIAPGVNHQELDSILSKALEFEDHQMDDRAWDEVDQAQALLDKNAPAQGSSDGEAGERPGDTSYTLSGDTATYTKNPNPNLYAFFGDAIKTHDVKVPGAAKIHTSDFNDHVEIQKNTPSQDQITVKVNKVDEKGRVTDSQTFLLDYKMLDSISIQGALTKNITVDGKPYYPGSVRKISVDGETKAEGLKSLNYDSKGVSDMMNTMAEGYDTNSRASHLKTLIESALNNQGSWQDVTKAITDLKKEDGNNAINLLVWSYVAYFGGYQAWGSNTDFDQEKGKQKTLQFLRLLPDDVKRALITKASEEDNHFKTTITADGVNGYFLNYFVGGTAGYVAGGSVSPLNPTPAYQPMSNGYVFTPVTTEDTVNLIQSAIQPTNETFQAMASEDDSGDDSSSSAPSSSPPPDPSQSPASGNSGS